MIETDNKLKGKINSNSSIKGSGISVKGETGNGIEKIEKTNTEGLIDTYTIYYTDGTTSTFQVSNGEKGDQGDKGDKGDTGEVSLEGLKKATENKRLRIEGKSDQIGIPTIENSVKIRNIGDNINLFDKSSIGSNYKYNDGLKLDRDNLRTTTIILTKKIKSGNYTISFKYGDKSTSNNFGIQFLNGSETIANVTFTTEKVKTFIINKEVDRFYFYINTAQASGIVLYLDEIKLEEGSTATPYSEYGCGSIDYKAENENKFSSDLEIGDIKNTTGLNDPNGNGIRTKDYIKVKPNTTYTIKNSNNYMNVVYFYTTNKTFINYSYSTDTSYTFSTESTVEYIRVRSSSANKQNDLATKYMLVEGSIAKPYVEHQEQTIYFPLSEGQLLHEEDYLAEDGIHQKRKTYIFTGTEEIELWGNGTDNAYRMVYKGLISEIKKSGLILSNYYSMKLPTQLYEFVEGIAIDTNGNIIIHDEKYSTIADFKSYLSQQYANGTPITIEYQLAEEIVTPLTQKQIEAYYELQKAKYVDEMELTCLNEIEPTLVDIDKSLEESLLDIENSIIEIKKQQEYSTEEQKIGKWIDGKPLYRKVINFGALPNNTTKSLLHNISNVKYIVHVEGFAKNQYDTDFRNLPFISATDTRADIQVWSDKSYIYSRTNYDMSTFTAYVVLEYTKTD